MISTVQVSKKTKRIRVALILMAALIVLAGAVCLLGCFFETEYPYLPTLWIAKHTKVPDGRLVADLIRIRSGNSYLQQHWHHCAWCEEVYPHAPHMAVRVIRGATQFRGVRRIMQVIPYLLIPMVTSTTWPPPLAMIRRLTTE